MQFLRHDWPEQKNLFGLGKWTIQRKEAIIDSVRMRRYDFENRA